MSRTTIWLLVFIYLAAATAFNAYEFQLDQPSWKLDGATAGLVIGGALVPFVGGAIIPIMGWAFGKFNKRYAGAVFVSWIIIGGMLAFLSDYGNRYDRNLQLEKLTSNSTLTGKDRHDFVRSMKLSCTQNQTASPLTAQLAISPAKISVYCDCMSERSATAISMDEIKYFVSNGKSAASFIDKTTALAQICSKEALLPKPR